MVTFIFGLGPGRRGRPGGRRVDERGTGHASTTPAMTRSASPDRAARAAIATVSRLEPQSRFTVPPGAETGSPASNVAKHVGGQVVLRGGRYFWILPLAVERQGRGTLPAVPASTAGPVPVVQELLHLGEGEVLDPKAQHDAGAGPFLQPGVRDTDHRDRGGLRVLVERVLHVGDRDVRRRIQTEPGGAGRRHRGRNAPYCRWRRLRAATC